MSRISEIAVGSLKVVALRDGELFLPSGALVNLSEQDLKTISNDENSRLAYSNVNAYLVQSENQNLLIDSGCRDLFGPTCGFVQEALKEAGLVPSDITDIFLTHLHPDHIAGTINTDGIAVFENATLKVLDKEYNFWSSQDFDEAEVNGADWANLAKAVLNAYKDRLETLSFDSDIAPGVSSVSIPGHTPGHSGFRVDDGNESLIQMGDILHVPNLQLINPNVATVFDIDPEAALKSRKGVLDMVSTDKMLCTSGHMLDQKFGYLEKNGTGYNFIA
jgi:glyoxylase-like metal-dependent hydrolase (beta-lactamase superfamily II)